MMLPKSLLSILVLAISLTTKVGGSLMDFARIKNNNENNNNNNDQHHRSLDAAEDCVTATIDLIDPLNNVSGLWFFPNYLALNFGVCNLTTAICDYNDTDYTEQSLSDCNAVGGKILQRDVRVCVDDVSKVSNAPAFADLDFVNVDFCFAQSCDESIPMVQLHRALYFKAEREKAPGTENPYANLEASSKGLCLDPETAVPVPTASPNADTSGGGAAYNGCNTLSSIGIMMTTGTLLWNTIMG
ncbi:unnamed protein product [Cylindrotheca closterium]|uniref:Uncharacterized protein n=1 Tax=Cylindrotheca closterium TaxID=2856 RepID=A0AAD2FGS5_9STRA|nr:unnamed protein product [Cylindrotheca closterium]